MRVFVLIVSTAAFAVALLWYGFLEPPYLSYKGLPFEPISPEVHAGEALLLRVTRCNDSDRTETYLITRKLIRIDAPKDAATEPILLPGGAVEIEPGCHEEISGANVVPRNTPLGLYVVRGQAAVPGRWRGTYVQWASAPFRVVAPVSP